ncbi:hypothetical protein ABNG42_001496, partial [Campylobacter jejuni]
NTRMSEQYNRLLDISSDKIHHLDKTLSAFDEKIERFGKNFELYEKAMLESQEKVFEGFKASLFEGMHKFKEVYEEEKSIDAKIKMMDELKKEMKALDEETSQMMSKLSGDENQNKENETKQIEDFSESKTEENQDEIQAEISKQESNDELKNEDKENK